MYLEVIFLTHFGSFLALTASGAPNRGCHIVQLFELQYYPLQWDVSWQQLLSITCLLILHIWYISLQLPKPKKKVGIKIQEKLRVSIVDHAEYRKSGIGGGKSLLEMVKAAMDQPDSDSDEDWDIDGEWRNSFHGDVHKNIIWDKWRRHLIG